ncbi:thymidylate synthase [Dactylosporangium sp. AC04546]|uniref:thymidylate synthase n=1 Tax=Dactylosporangium sp. AC04546 TaxID=2862460 RepID=UPI001EDDFFA4|nr:thymidylate synthase [Dactylosporangium sp. AC04546]WVK78877.1 thymidylate synthase [Dactylosporangium sp. AC04546]
MLNPASFATFTDAYLAVLRTIADGPHYVTAGRGKDAWEVPNVSFRLDDPVARTLYLAARRANPVFNVAEFLWYVAGRDDLDMIAYYAPRLRQLSLDGQHLAGTAYGPRLFAPGGTDHRSQFQRVLDLTVHEQDSKRAAMIVMRPDELEDPNHPDVACTLALQLMRRDGKLHMTSYMRGNDAKIGLLCDVYSFTMILEFAARLQRVPVGTYTHHVGSMHINTADLDHVRAILAEADTAPADPFPADPMPADTDWSVIGEVLHHEEALRNNHRALSPAAAAELAVGLYWQRIVLLLEAYRQIQHTTEPVTRDVLGALHPGHRWLLAHRWPDRIPAATVHR